MSDEAAEDEGQAVVQVWGREQMRAGKGEGEDGRCWGLRYLSGVMVLKLEPVSIICRAS